MVARVVLIIGGASRSRRVDSGDTSMSISPVYICVYE